MPTTFVVKGRVPASLRKELLRRTSRRRSRALRRRSVPWPVRRRCRGARARSRVTGDALLAGATRRRRRAACAGFAAPLRPRLRRQRAPQRPAIRRDPRNRATHPAQPALLHISNGSYPGSHSCRTAVFAARQPTVMTVNNHARHREGTVGLAYRAIDPVVWRSLDAIICPSNATAEALAARRGAPRRLVHVVH